MGVTACAALGCLCKAWVGIHPLAPPWTEEGLTTEQVAQRLGRSETYVKDHAEALGGVRLPQHWLVSNGGQRGGHRIWRFDPEVLEAVLASP